MTHPLLQSNITQRVKRALLLVPVNTIANWEDEFKKWAIKGVPQFVTYNFNDVKDTTGRLSLLESWFNRGGVLYCSFDTFVRFAKTEKNDIVKKCLQSPGPDSKLNLYT